MGKKKIKWESLLCFSIAIIMILLGILMIVLDHVISGKHYLTQQNSTIGGVSIILIGIIILIVGYYSLSPFSKIREFFEGRH